MGRKHRAKGAVTLWLAASLLSLVIFASVALDTARLVYQRQQLQSVADLAATEVGLQNPYYLDDRQKEAILDRLTARFSGKIDTLTIDYGTAKIINKMWVVDTGSTPDNGYPAAKVTVTKTVPQSLVAGGLFNSNSMTLYAEAAIQKAGTIRFGLGSRTLSTAEDAGFLNSIFNATLGTSLALDIASYNGLAKSSIELGRLLNVLAVDLGVGSSEEVLESNISLLDLLTTYLNVLSNDDDFPDGLNMIINELSMAETVPDIRLADILRLSESNTDGAALETSLNALTLIKSSIYASNNNHFVHVPTSSLDIPNITSLSFETNIISPPSFTIATLPVVEGHEPTATTSQVALQLSAEILTDSVLDPVLGVLDNPLLGLTLSIEPVSINVEVAKASATLTDVMRTSDGMTGIVTADSPLIGIQVAPLQIQVNLTVLGIPTTLGLEATVTIENTTQDPPAYSIVIPSKDATVIDNNPQFTTDVEVGLQTGVVDVSILNPLLSTLSTALDPIVSALLSDAVLPILDNLDIHVGGADLWVESIQSSSSGLIL